MEGFTTPPVSVPEGRGLWGCGVLIVVALDAIEFADDGTMLLFRTVLTTEAKEGVESSGGLTPPSQSPSPPFTEDFWLLEIDRAPTSEFRLPGDLFPLPPVAPLPLTELDRSPQPFDAGAGVIAEPGLPPTLPRPPCTPLPPAPPLPLTELDKSPQPFEVEAGVGVTAEPGRLIEETEGLCDDNGRGLGVDVEEALDNGLPGLIDCLIFVGVDVLPFVDEGDPGTTSNGFLIRLASLGFLTPFLRSRV